MRYTISLILLTVVLAVQTVQAQDPERPFKTHLYNAEYDVFLTIDFDTQQLNVPGHELYGPLAGYLGRPTNSFYWVVLSATVKDKEATMQLVNDFGSEDLVATLRQTNDSTYVMTQGKGSVIKVPNNGKWLKLPKTVTFKKKQQ